MCPFILTKRINDLSLFVITENRLLQPSILVFNSEVLKLSVPLTSLLCDSAFSSHIFWLKDCFSTLNLLQSHSPLDFTIRSSISQADGILHIIISFHQFPWLHSYIQFTMVMCITSASLCVVITTAFFNQQNINFITSAPHSWPSSVLVTVYTQRYFVLSSETNNVRSACSLQRQATER